LRLHVPAAIDAGGWVAIQAAGQSCQGSSGARSAISRNTAADARQAMAK
jgi:hypothetical protein